MSEQELLSAIASDLLTGNYLLGRPRSKEHMDLMKEFAVAAGKVNERLDISEREKELLRNMSDVFYGGPEDMCEQLGIDKVLMDYLSS